MKKFLFLALFSLAICEYSNSQTISITKITVHSSPTSISTEYTNPNISLSSNNIPYSATRIEFSWDDFDPSSLPSDQIRFTLVRNDGFSSTLISSVSYFMNSGNMSSSTYLTDGTFITSGTTSFTIKATYINSNNQETLLTESNPWSITIIPATNQIFGNKICCNQTTFAYPFDASVISQDNSITVSTQDNAAITSIQWQRLIGATWSNISGATQMFYDPPSTSINIKFRRILQSASGATNTSNEISITRILEVISGNSICCSQTTPLMPFDPSILQQSNNITLSSNVPGVTFTYQWQDSISGVWNNIIGATNSSFDPLLIKNQTRFRRIAISSTASQNISNTVNVLIQSCIRPNDQQNLICGDQAFYKLQNGDIIYPKEIIGAFINPNISRREFGFDYMMSYDKINWFNVKAKYLLCDGKDFFCTEDHYICNNEQVDLADNSYTQIKKCAINRGVLDYQTHYLIFDLSKGPVQHVYIKRDYYHWYDEFNCGFLNTFPCGAQWYLKSSSNIVTITLTSGDFPKPVAPITSSRNNVNCIWGDQTLTFSVPQLNNQEQYRWIIPAEWTAYTALEGPYVNTISVSTNSGDGTYAKGGQVCLEVTQGGQPDRQCVTITGSSPTTIVLPATIQGCEGQAVIVKPILVQNNAIANPADYNFSWQAYQSQNINCGNPALNNCKELSLTVSNVRQNPTQVISLRVRDNLGCKTDASTILVTTPGLQMGILNSYSDPKAISNSGLAINTVNNYLYFTGQNKNIYRSYYDNTPGQLIWKYIPLKDKNTNQAITSDGPVAYYKGTIDKLFYIINSSLYYAESTDNGLTWVDKFALGSIASNVDSRIKIYGTNIYYINNSTRQVSYKNIANTTSSAILVGSDQVNYSQRMFTVEDGILSYADVNSNIVAFDANSGIRFNINIPAQIKQVNYNSSISTYNNNLYYTSSSGNLRILKKNISTGIYDNYEEVSNPPSNNLQLAGPFAINKQTGTVYAKAYDVLGKQIYYLNGKWNFLPISSPLSYSAIQSDMTYTNEHAYYIGDNGYLSNTYYIAPCIPEVLRTSNAFDASGDIMNDPLSNNITEDNSILFYPNPTTGIVKANFTFTNESVIQIKIIPVTGGNTDIIYNSSVQTGSQEIPFDMSPYAAGIYIIQVYVDGSLYTKSKLIKY